MIETFTKYKKYIICLAIVMLLSTLFFKINYLMKNKNNEHLPEVKLKDIKNKKSFAIMVQNGENYKEYSSDTWPDEEYKFKEAKCTDNNGNLIENAVSFESDKVILETDKTVICTLYFDKSTLGKLRDNEKLANKDNLSSDLQGGMYRYQGTDNVDNWICFGTTDNCGTSDTLLDKYMYRIIGITPNGELYLLKETFVKEGDITGFSWNKNYSISDCLGEACEWPNADLYKRLNGTSNGDIQGTGKYDGANTDIFADSKDYEYMTQENNWYKLIADHNWMYGDTNEYDLNNSYNGNHMYGIETGNPATKRYWPDEDTQITCSDNNPCTEKEYTWNKSTNATKISLMYKHDVAYAYYDGETEESRGNPGNKDNIKNSWIYFQKDGYNTLLDFEWLSTRFGIGDINLPNVHAFAINKDGFISNRALNIELGTRPIFYLKSSVKIDSGAGTKANPFILTIK